MREVGIVCDSVIDIPPEVASTLDITLAPVSLIVNGETFVDAPTLDRRAFVDRLAHAHAFSTSGVNVHDFEVAYREALSRAKSLIVFCMASTLSVTFTAATAAAELIEDSRIKVYDSGGAFVGQAALAVAAAHRALSGATLEQISPFADTAIPRCQSLIISPNLATLQSIGRIARDGQISSHDAQLALLRIAGGNIVAIGAAADYDEAIDKLVNEAALGLQLGGSIYAAVAHVRNAEVGNRLNRLVTRRFECRHIVRIEESPIGAILGGVGAVGFGYCPVPYTAHDFGL